MPIKLLQCMFFCRLFIKFLNNFTVLASLHTILKRYKRGAFFCQYIVWYAWVYTRLSYLLDDFACKFRLCFMFVAGVS